MTTFNPLATIYDPQGGQQVGPFSLSSPRLTSSSLSSSAPTPTVFLSRLPPTMTEAQLLSLAAPYGAVKSARFVQRAQEGKSFGFLQFNSVVESQACILGLMDQGYKVSFARETLKEKLERLADPYATNIYVKNLPADYSPQALERLFAPSIIVSSKVLETGRGGVVGKGVALVRLQTRDEAHAAVDALHGRILPGCASPLVVRFADNLAQKEVREEAARIKRKALDSPGESWTTSMPSPQTPNTPFPFQQAATYPLFNSYGYPAYQPTTGVYPQLQHQQQQARGFNPAYISFPPSTATSATSSTFGNVGLGLVHPKAPFGVGAEDEQWQRINW